MHINFILILAVLFSHLIKFYEYVINLFYSTYYFVLCKISMEECQMSMLQRKTFNIVNNKIKFQIKGISYETFQFPL